MTTATPIELSGFSLIERTHVAERGLTIDVVADPSQFAAMRGEWNELLAGSNADCVFLTWEWLHTWWTHFNEDLDLFIVTVRSGSQLVALAPLTLRRVRVGPVLVPLLEFIATGTVGSDYLDFIVAPNREQAALDALTSFFATTRMSMRLSNVKKESSVHAMSLALEEQGWDSVAGATNIAPFIDLTNHTWDSYLAALGSSHRYNFRRRLRNLRSEFDVHFVRAESDEQRHEALRHVVNLHLQRWSTRGGSDAFNDPRLLAFHDGFTRLAMERGWLRLYVLNLNGHAAAAFYAFRYGETFYFYQSGFDPAFEKYSLGLITMGLTIEHAINEGAAEYDLLHGNETYKSLWAAEARPLVRLELYPSGAMGRMHRNTRRAVSIAKRIAKRVLKS